MGWHKIFGTSIDSGVGNYFDKIYLKCFKDQRANISSSIKQALPKTNLKAADFDFLSHPDPYGGEFIEKLGMHGKHEQFPMNIPLFRDNSTDMSFTGLQAQIINAFIGKYTDRPIDMDIINLAASSQYSAFKQIEMKTDRVVRTIQKMKIPINSINLAGGCSQNKR